MAQKPCLLELLLSPEASKSTSHSLSLCFSQHLVRLFITLGLKRGGLMAEKLRSQGLDPDGVTLESLLTRHVEGGTIEMAWGAAASGQDSRDGRTPVFLSFFFFFFLVCSQFFFFNI